MSKKPRRKAFGSPPMTAEKYSEHLNVAESKGTIASVGGIEDVESTDKRASETVIERTPPKQGFTIPGFVWKGIVGIGILATFIAAILSVGRKVWSIEDSIKDMDTEIVGIKSDIKESGRERISLKMSLERLMGRVEAYFYSSKNEEPKEKANNNNIK